MDYQDYLNLLDRATQLLISKNYKEAENELYPLLLSDISELDKANVCLMLAKIHDRIGGSEEALGWYDKGIAYEQPYCRFEAAQEKAHYLAELGHYTDAIAVFEDLLKQPFLTEAEKENVRARISRCF